jgi:hypothetical protein
MVLILTHLAEKGSDLITFKIKDKVNLTKLTTGNFMVLFPSEHKIIPQ